MPYLARPLARLALLLAAFLSLAGPLTSSAAAAAILAPAAPGAVYLGLHLESANAFTDSGSTIVVNGQAAGYLLLDTLTSGPIGTTVSWDLPANMPGASAAPLNGGLSLLLNFYPGAPPINLGAHLYDAAGGLLASLSRTVSFDAAPPILTGLSLATLSETKTTVSGQLTWREQDQAGSRVIARSVVIDKALPLSSGGCPNWTAFRLYTPSAPALDPLPINSDPAGQLNPADQPHDLAVSIPNLPLGACYRAKVFAYDEQGLIISAFSALIAPGLVYKNGLPIAPYSGQLDLYRPGAFVSQQTYQWCIPASAQMMLNLLLGPRAPQGPTVQRSLMDVAQAHDSLDASLGGTTAAGWVAALARYTSVRYEVQTLPSLAAAVSLAARRMAQTGKPVGIVVWGGKHAWVLHGFEAKTNPATDAHAVITAVRISGPLWPRPAENALYDPAPDTRMTVAALAGRFTRAFGGGWIVVVPVVGK